MSVIIAKDSSTTSLPRMSIMAAEFHEERTIVRTIVYLPRVKKCSLVS